MSFFFLYNALASPKNNISESWRELLLLRPFSVKKRNIVIMDPRSACALFLAFMKIHFVGKSLWVMQNNNGVKQRFLACFLKILD